MNARSATADLDAATIHEFDRQNTAGDSLQALRAADRRKDEFIAMLAHELRGPLGPIRMAAAILSRPEVAAEIAEEARTVIDRQINDMARLIDELLDVAKMTQGKMQLDLTRVNLAEVVRRSLDVVQGALVDRGQQLSVSLPDTPPYVRGDRTRLQQVFGNLLTNASKFSKRSARIWLDMDASIGDRSGEVSVHVRDEGIGVAADRLSRVFQLFEQAGESPHHSRGLGVGLAIVQQIVELHGGTVRVESDGSAHGSTFTVTLPLLQERDADTDDAVERELVPIMHLVPSTQVSSVEIPVKSALTPGPVVCPLCHMPEPTMTQEALDAGGRWRCTRCSQSWDGQRLRTRAAYSAWARDHDRR